jgi:hypothetical protein
MIYDIGLVSLGLVLGFNLGIILMIQLGTRND